MVIRLNGLSHQSSKSEVGGSSPSGAKKLKIGQTFSGQSYQIFEPLAQHSILPPRLNLVPGNI